MKTQGQKQFEQQRAAEYRGYIDGAANQFGLTEADLKTMTKVGLIRHGLDQDVEDWIRLKYLAKELDILYRTTAMAKAYARMKDVGGDFDESTINRIERLSKAFKLYDNTFRIVDSDAVGRLMSCLDGWDATLNDMEKGEFDKQVEEDIDELITKLEQPEA